ncbi:hypothetical protein E3U55_06615 [Filobacillus milosensis]|uniref:ParB/Sulfiredoxin domain-containing protein n=1 Tax=Filobacillus milosensis TaxID=94137 RepID=A0A4Y8INA7_9BACI|nr:hypothetical protein [Filobacillus milosensis]TFB22907.1 hypothetical protein E3U55_06615 [Filobacillus milosensis]
MSRIPYYEQESFHFRPEVHVKTRIKEIANSSDIGAKIALGWEHKLEELLNEKYPVNHPVGKETFSLYGDFPSGIFEYALDIDGATMLIKEKQMTPTIFNPGDIIHAVDQGNVNTDPSKINPNHKNPVMIVKSQVLTDNQFYCINGNHRINEAFKCGANDIEVYAFEELDIVPIFYDQLSEAIYYLENDYQYLVEGKPLPKGFNLGAYIKK